MPSKGRNKSKGKRRQKVTSLGLRKHSKHPLTLVQRALLGKGQVQSVRPAGLSSWMGAREPSNPPWDAEQVELNKKLYPDLFRDAS